jgi:hypothetical protein
VGVDDSVLWLSSLNKKQGGAKLVSPERFRMFVVMLNLEIGYISMLFKHYRNLWQAYIDHNLKIASFDEVCIHTLDVYVFYRPLYFSFTHC